MSKVDWIYKIIKRYQLEAQIIDRIFKDNPDLDPNPVKQIHELEDKPGNIYLWEVDGTDEQVVALNEKIRKNFVKTYNRDPKALHIVENDVDAIEEIPPAKIKEVVKPWLQKQNENE